jgi:hypothetical protein
MGYVEKLLASSERIVKLARDHWITLLTATLVDSVVAMIIIGLSVAGVIVSGWFVPLLGGLLLLAVPVGHLSFRIWVWWNRQHIITTHRIIQVSGTVRKRVSDTLLEKINDIVTEQSAMGRLLDYGDVEIIAGSESGIDAFYRLADPVGFKKALLEQKAALLGRPQALDVSEAPARGKTDAADVPELIAELDELRKQGLITDAEFQEKRRKLLDRI